MIISQGKSSTGTAHSIGVEPHGDGVKLTILGHDGKKRHASIILSHDAATIFGELTAYIARHDA